MVSEESLQALIHGLLSGDRRSLSRLISIVESDDAKVERIYPSIKDRLGKAEIIGITGPPGAGKSTLSSSLADSYRRMQKSVGILAFDPSSPFSGGSVLGDRVRMQNHYLDDKVFIRSFSNRGASGGVAPVAFDAIHLLDAFGFDVILVETVGVGQTELDVVNLVDLVVVVVVPESGDSIQSMKAGLMEVADVFVVNKCDRLGADRMVANIKSATNLIQNQANDQVRILKTQADKAVGIDELAEIIDGIHTDRMSTGWLQSYRGKRRISAMLDWARLDFNRKMNLMTNTAVLSIGISQVFDKVESGQLNPREGSKLILKAMANSSLDI